MPIPATPPLGMLLKNLTASLTVPCLIGGTCFGFPVGGSGSTADEACPGRLTCDPGTMGRGGGGALSLRAPGEGFWPAGGIGGGRTLGEERGESAGDNGL